MRLRGYNNGKRHYRGFRHVDPETRRVKTQPEDWVMTWRELFATFFPPIAVILFIIGMCIYSHNHF